MTPRRIQLRRTRGWRMPENTVKVDRSTRWGNPLRVGMWKGYTAAQAVADFRRWIMRDLSVRSYENAFGQPPGLDEIRRELRGKNIACWCGEDDPCHGDVYLELANAADPTP